MTLVGHKIDPITRYCVRCGVARQDVEDGTRKFCDMVGNVTAISHLLVYKRLEALEREITSSAKEQPVPA